MTAKDSNPKISKSPIVGAPPAHAPLPPSSHSLSLRVSSSLIVSRSQLNSWLYIFFFSKKKLPAQ
jgi:hypothetical protein